MGHAVSVFIGQKAVMHAMSRALQGAPCYSLSPTPFLLMPVSDGVFDFATAKHGDAEPISEGFYRLSNSLSRIAQECSRVGPLAFCFTEYWGGSGHQGAIAWIEGRQFNEPYLAAMGPINQALKAIGVPRIDGMDEFDSVGLGDVRSESSFEKFTVALGSI